MNYQFSYPADDAGVDDITSALETHGLAIVTNVLDDDTVSKLMNTIEPEFGSEAGSHLWDEQRSAQEHEITRAEMPRGSVARKLPEKAQRLLGYQASPMYGWARGRTSDNLLEADRSASRYVNAGLNES